MWANRISMDLLLPFLENDTASRTAFFSSLRVLFYAAAALPPKTRARLEAVAAAAGRSDVFITSAWGSTETSPLSTSAYFPTATPAVIGLPAPGTHIKLAIPEGGSTRREIRVKGPNVTPGYWRPGGGVVPPALDPGGFLPTSDAGRLSDPANPEAGIVFEGHRVTRALVLAEPPSLDAGETTDKGYLNQRRVLDRRTAQVERLFAATPDAEDMRP